MTKNYHLGTLGSPDRNWVEDYGYENGHYMNRCYKCKETFIGHRGRFICKACFPKPSAEASDESDIHGDSGDLRPSDSGKVDQ